MRVYMEKRITISWDWKYLALCVSLQTKVHIFVEDARQCKSRWHNGGAAAEHPGSFNCWHRGRKKMHIAETFKPVHACPNHKIDFNAYTAWWTTTVNDVGCTWVDACFPKTLLHAYARFSWFEHINRQVELLTGAHACHFWYCTTPDKQNHTYTPTDLRIDAHGCQCLLMWWFVLRIWWRLLFVVAITIFVCTAQMT